MNSAAIAPLFDATARPLEKRAGPRPGRPTKKESERRHAALLDHALELFLERGFDGTSIEAIIDSVGMARRTVYGRYGDKEALFKAALQRAIDAWVVPASRLSEAESDDLETTLLNVARLMAANARSPSGVRLARIANAEVVRMPEIGAYLWDRTAKLTLAYLTDLFGRYLSPDIADDAAHSFLLLIVEGAFQSNIWLDISDEEFDRQLQFRTRLFLHGAMAQTGNQPGKNA